MRAIALRTATRSLLRRVALWAALAYIVVLALIAYWPTPVDRDAHGTLVTVIDWLQVRGVPDWVNYHLVEFSANVVLFAPVGLLVVILTPERWWLGIVVGFAASCAIELGQLVFLPQRFATGSDILANTIGAAIGTLIGRIVLGRIARRSRRAESAERRPPATARENSRH